VRASFYDWFYRIWAPWASVGVRPDLVELLGRGDVDATRYPRALDLGCGTGANVVHLAECGFEPYGVDFSAVALRKARQRAASASVAATFVEGDLTQSSIPGLEGQFDLLMDFGTLDDLKPGTARADMAALATRLARPGAKFLEWCWYGERESLPRISFVGGSRLGHISPAELQSLFAEHWEIEPFSSDARWNTACFLLTRR
jgi:SAM-dependent methyltransferase